MPTKKTTKKTSTKASPTNRQKPSKQAVVIIHGIGQQQPMDTTWGFVKSMWVRNSRIHKPNTAATVWSKPLSGDLNTELRRITTGYNTGGLRTDFFEFYYQHLIKDTRLSHVFSWAKTLLLRSPELVPKQLRSAYWLLWSMLLLAATLIGTGTVGTDGSLFNTQSFLGLVVLGVANYILTKIVGDAARYLVPSPENLEIRDQIKNAGAKLLLRLSRLGSETEQGNEYCRIIVMGHSLGSVVAYDIVQQAWISQYELCGDGGQRSRLGKARIALEQLLRSDNVDWQQAQPLQRAYFNALNSKPESNWLIEHLITCGSPLAHADMLMADDNQELQEKINLRELSICLPLPEGSGDRCRFTYSSHDTDGTIPHHAAAFAATRWTNIYFPSKAILIGDVVGGPVGHLFGSGIRDLPVRTGEQGGLLLHTRYWKANDNEASHLNAFREVLDLADTLGKSIQ